LKQGETSWSRPSRSTVVFFVVWNLAICSVAVVAGADARWVAAIGVAAIVATIAVGYVRRRGMRPDRLGELTGALRSPGYVVVDGVPVEVANRSRWVGAASVPTWLGRLEASAPFASLEVEGHSVALRVRPKVLATVFGARSLVVSPEGLDSVFPVARRFGGGVALKPTDSPPYYFWTGDTQAVLTALHALQFPVDWAVRKRTR
jgi:hypothetical protein